MSALISVIIVLFRSDKYVSGCIKSIRKSAEKAGLKIEFIAVINDSNNNRYVLPKDVKICRSGKNLGYAAAINRGARLAKGDWLLIANPDTLTSANALGFLLKHVKEEKIALIGPKICHSDGTVQLSLCGFPSVWSILLEESYLYKLWPFYYLSPKTKPSNYEFTHFADCIEGTFFMVRNKYFRELGGMDERFFMYFEDLDLCRRLSDKGLIIVFEPGAKVTHFQSGSSGGQMLPEIYAASFMRLVLKYHSKNYTLTCLFVMLSGSMLRQFYWTMKVLISRNTISKSRAVNKMKYFRGLAASLFKILRSSRNHSANLQ